MGFSDRLCGKLRRSGDQKDVRLGCFQPDDLGIDGRFCDLVGGHRNTLLEPGSEYVPQSGKIVATKIVILGQHRKFRCAQFLNGVPGIESRLEAERSLNAQQRVWELRDIAELRRARRKEELGNVLAV